MSGRDAALARVGSLRERVARFDDLLEVAPKEEKATFEMTSVIGGLWARPSFWTEAILR